MRKTQENLRFSVCIYFVYTICRKHSVNPRVSFFAAGYTEVRKYADELKFSIVIE